MGENKPNKGVDPTMKLFGNIKINNCGYLKLGGYDSLALIKKLKTPFCVCVFM